jgi:hypothetical protein
MKYRIQVGTTINLSHKPSHTFAKVQGKIIAKKTSAFPKDFILIVGGFLL